MAQIQRVRMAPPEGKPWNTVYVTGSENVRIKLNAGWTIVQANGHADTDIKPEGMSTDPPKEVAERIEQVLGEKPKGKRPRIQRPVTALIGLILSASMFAQGPTPADTLTFVRPISSRVTTEGHHMVNILTKGPSNREYVIEVGWEDWEALKVGELVGPKLKQKP